MSEEEIPTRRFPRGPKLWAPAAGFIALGVGLLAVVPGLLLQNWIPGATVEERGKLLGSAAQVVLLGLGGVIAVIGVALSLARHGQSLTDADEARRREDMRRQEFLDQIALERDRETARLREFELQRKTELERDLRSRFLGAVELLSAEAPTNRTAALYALAALGDDWLAFGKPNELQVCIDVMCGYLRSAVPDDWRTPDEGSVRVTGYDLIRQHLLLGLEELTPAWSGCQFPLARAPIWFVVDFSWVTLNAGTKIDLSGTQVSGTGRINFNSASIRDGASVDIHSAKLTELATLNFRDARITDQGRLGLQHTSVLDGANIAAERVAVANHGVISMDHVNVQSLVDLSQSTVASSGKITAVHATLGEHGRLILDHARATDGGRLVLRDVRLDPAATLSVEGILADDGVFDLSTHKVVAKIEVDLK